MYSFHDESDFNVVERQITAVYRENRSDMVWSLPDYISVFRCFYAYYYHYMGITHPFLTKPQILRVMLALPNVGDDYRDIDIDAEDYEDLIDAYFQVEFPYGCNYSILHFVSGNIRSNRMYETWHC